MFREKLCQGYDAPPSIKRQAERQRGNALVTIAVRFSVLHYLRVFHVHVLWHDIDITKGCEIL
jgi:hypothetical protein